MKAMVLAAGLGTRLRPMTDARPKALVEVGGRTLLEITLARLRKCGVSEVIINVHHFAEMVMDYLKLKDNFGLSIEISREDILLDTGGGLKKAAPFFLRDHSDEPFILHNVDVISTIDLGQMLQYHRDKGALATLAVQKRDSSRQLLFDLCGQLCGRTTGRDQSPEIVRQANELHPMAFSGIHIISPRLISLIEGDGVFSIIPTYLKLAAAGEKIVAFPADEYYWRDLGKPESLRQAADDFSKGLFD